MANRERVQRIVRRLERMEEAKLEIVEKVVMILAAADIRTVARIHQMAMAVWRSTKKNATYSGIDKSREV